MAFKSRLIKRTILLLSACFICFCAAQWFVYDKLTDAQITQYAGGLMIFSGQRPNTLGVTDNKLADCPTSPNCVSSMTSSEAHFIQPLTFSDQTDSEMHKLKELLSTQRGFRIISSTRHYLHVECRSRLLGFVDDLEFYCDEESHLCHVRSASRLGRSDFGVNRARVEKIRTLFSE